MALAGALISSALLTSGCQKLKARDDLNNGVHAYQATQYSQAVNFFKEACDLGSELGHSAAVSCHGLHEPVDSGSGIGRKQ